MKILFVIHDVTYLRNFTTTLRILAERGHQTVLAMPPKLRDGERQTRKLPRALAKLEAVTCVELPEAGRTRAWKLAKMIRSAADFVRYKDPDFQKAYRIRERAEERVINSMRSLIQEDRPWTEQLRELLWLESGIPEPVEVRDFVAEQKPDCLLVTPLVSSPTRYQADYLKAARKLGIPTALPVFSWDNLSNKGTLRVIPDRLIVWNEIQKQEAIRWHAVPEERVRLTGGARFDAFFRYQPEHSRETFCERLGLDPSRAILTYFCSSRFIAEDELDFVLEWLEALRACAHERLREAGVIIRPYPSRLPEWQAVDWARFGPVCLNAEEDAVNGVLECVSHSELVVGINTTAMLEAAAVGKPIFSLKHPLTRAGQEGNFHFHYLAVEPGLLHLAEDLPAHIDELARCLDDPGAYQARSQTFCERFLRPPGKGKAAAHLADAIGELEGLRAGFSLPERFRAWRARRALLQRYVPEEERAGSLLAPLQSD